MSRASTALEFVFNTKIISKLRLQDLVSMTTHAAKDSMQPMILSDEEAKYLQISPSGTVGKTPIWHLNDEQNQKLEEFHLNLLGNDFSKEEKEQLVALRNQTSTLLFTKDSTLKKEHFFKSLVPFAYGIEAIQGGWPEGDAKKLNQLFPSMAAALFYMNVYLATHKENSQPLSELADAIHFKGSASFPTFREWGEGHSEKMFKNLDFLSLCTKHFETILAQYPKTQLAKTAGAEFLKVIDEQEIMDALKNAPYIGTLTNADRAVAKRVGELNERFKHNPDGPPRSKYDYLNEIIPIMRRAANSDEFIPNVNIKCTPDTQTKETINIRKLEKSDPVALLMGHLVSCCQRMGKEGEACAVHSVVSDKGGIYVFELSNGELLAESWAWYAGNGTLCMDSVEINPKARQKLEAEGVFVDGLLKILYSELASRLLEENPKIQQVFVGIGGKTPELVGHGAFSYKIAPYGEDGNYKDSSHQRLLARRGKNGLDPLYEINEANHQRILDSLLHNPETTNEFFRVFPAMLDYSDIINSYFIGEYTALNSVKQMPIESERNQNEIYLVYDAAQKNFQASFYRNNTWQSQTFSCSESLKSLLNKNYVTLDLGKLDYSVVELFHEVVNKCNLPPSKVSQSGVTVPDWFKLVFNAKKPCMSVIYKDEMIRNIAKSVPEAGFILPDSIDSLAYIVLQQGLFDVFDTLKSTLTKEIIDRGNDSDSCLLCCAKKYSELADNNKENQQKYYAVMVELLQRNADPHRRNLEGESLVHYLCKSIRTQEDYLNIMNWVNTYHLDLFTPAYDGIKPFQDITANMPIHTLSELNEFKKNTPFAHINNINFFSASKVFAVRPDEMHLWRDALADLDLNTLNKGIIQQIFMAHIVCLEARTLIFEKLQQSGYPSDLLLNYLNNIHDITHVTEYEQLRNLYKKIGHPCKRTLFDFQKLDMSTEHFSSFKDYLMANKPDTIKLVTLIRNALNSPDPNINAVLLLLTMQQGKTIDSPEKIGNLFAKTKDTIDPTILKNFLDKFNLNEDLVHAFMNNKEINLETRHVFLSHPNIHIPRYRILKIYGLEEFIVFKSVYAQKNRPLDLGEVYKVSGKIFDELELAALKKYAQEGELSQKDLDSLGQFLLTEKNIPPEAIYFVFSGAAITATESSVWRLLNILKNMAVSDRENFVMLSTLLLSTKNLNVIRIAGEELLPLMSENETTQIFLDERVKEIMLHAPEKFANILENWVYQKVITEERSNQLLGLSRTQQVQPNEPASVEMPEKNNVSSSTRGNRAMQYHATQWEKRQETNPVNKKNVPISFFKEAKQVLKKNGHEENMSKKPHR